MVERRITGEPTEVITEEVTVETPDELTVDNIEMTEDGGALVNPMSEQEEVEFEVSGVNYRAVWQRHRSGNSSGGKIQPPKRYIYDEVGQSLVRGTKEAEQENKT